MVGVMRAVCLVVVTFLWTVTHVRADSEVLCPFMGSCVLPCRFQAGDQEVIRWIHTTAGDATVHSYYHNQDQLANQSPRFRGRTLLFKDKISTGDASLQLTRVDVQDQGQYKCYASTIISIKEFFINLKVHAPVRNVDVKQPGNRITCSSDSIYPQPKVTWSTSPDSIQPLNSTTEVQTTSQKLFSISSSLILSDRVTHPVYICDISSLESSRRAIVTNLPDVNGSSDTDTFIPCTASNNSLTYFNLTWTFNHTETILTQTEDMVHSVDAEQWKTHVKDVSSTGTLILTELSVKHSGIYTCELRNAEGTFVSNTLMKINPSQTSSSGGHSSSVIAAVVLVPAAVGLLIIGLVVYLKRTDLHCTQDHDKNKTKYTKTDQQLTAVSQE